MASTATVLDRTGLGRLLRRLGSWRGTLVLNYHRIGDRAASPFDRALFSATPAEFDTHLAVLAREADVVGIEELRTPVARGRRVLITFDDGYRDNHDAALPVLRAHGMPATFFLATGFLDGPRLSWWDEIAWIVRRRGGPGPERQITEWVDRYKRTPGEQAPALLDELAIRTGVGRPPAEVAEGLWMTWDMARALRDAGMGIGGHSVNHPVLSRMPASAQEAEIGGCAQRLREELGLPMRWFSYPVGLDGTYDDATQRALRAAGCELAFTFAGGYAPRGPAAMLEIPRTGIRQGTPARRIRALLTLPQVYARW